MHSGWMGSKHRIFMVRNGVSRKAERLWKFLAAGSIMVSMPRKCRMGYAGAACHVMDCSVVWCLPGVYGGSGPEVGMGPGVTRLRKRLEETFIFADVRQAAFGNLRSSAPSADSL
jgi:hypothetical protein